MSDHPLKIAVDRLGQCTSRRTMMWTRPDRATMLTVRNNYQMPLVRYFVFVGGVLLTLLLVVGSFAPEPIVVARNGSAVDKTIVRIRSDRKLPDRVVYDTSLPTIVPPTTSVPVDATPLPSVADASTHAPVHDSFAQLAPTDSKKLEPKRKRKVAKVRANARVRVVHQFGFFGGPGGNNSGL